MLIIHTMHINDETYNMMRVGLIAGSAALGAALVATYTDYNVDTTLGMLAIAGGGAVLADTTQQNIETEWDPFAVLTMNPPTMTGTLGRVIAYALGLYLTQARGPVEVAVAVGGTCAAGQLLSNRITDFIFLR